MKNICALLMFGMVSIHGMQLKQISLKQSECDPRYKASPNANPAVLMAVGQSRISLINPAEVYLERSSRESAMNWLNTLYVASGLSGCVSKERFMVSTLREIKERIFNHENEIKALELLQSPGECCTEPKQPMSWCGGANFWLSFTALAGSGIATWVMAPKYYAPTGFNLCYVRADNGYSIVHKIYWDSIAENKPCNFTQLGDWEAIDCSYALAYAICKKEGEAYNHFVYPKEMFKAFVPLIIAVPSVITLQLLFQLAGYKYRRIMRERSAAAQELEKIETI